MKKASHTVISTILILAVSLFSETIYSSDDDSIHLYIETVDLKPTPQILRYSLVRALLNYNWEIRAVENNQIDAENRDALLEVKFLEGLVVELKMKPKGTRSPRDKWLQSIKNLTVRELQYYYYIQQFDL